ncbi:Sortase family protein [Micromonospora coriariae]|uniref:Sortase family protein n=1 Tax=Micromonospora coriariae TaxID=285665 RepID=A0A1C4WVN3_9ACTN|nr:class F sortase [Micromonospora coriariae]SCF00238.1 Sortase family protein [Micromonospora coriariae]
MAAAPHHLVNIGPAIRRHRDRRVPLAALVAAGAAVCLAAGTGVGLATTGPAPPPAASWQPGCTDDCPSAAAAPAPQGPPTRVRVPRIGVDSALTVLGLDRAGTLIPPADFDTVGWYGGGPAPGDTGPAVLAGHLDSRRGPAVFARLGDLRPGDRVEVRRGGQRLSFRVTGSLRTRKDRFPTAVVYGPTPGPELRLVTCGGDFDRRRGHYRDNVVVFAVGDAADPALPESAAG